MKFLAPYSEKSDARGSFQGLVDSMTFEELNLLFTRAGAHRGGHYHEHTRELFVLLSGRLELCVTALDGKDLFRGCILPGTTFVIEPRELHSVTAIDDCTWLNALTRRFDPLAPDFHVPSPTV